MLDHQVSEYIKPKFLETGILDWLTDKNLTTDDITTNWMLQYMFGKDYDKIEYILPGMPTSDYYHDVLNSDGTSSLSKMLQDDALKYFETLYNMNQVTYTTSIGIPLPTKRGVMEDLHFAYYSQGRVIVPKEITVDGTTYPVTAISSMAFRLCTKINFVQLPEGVKPEARATMILQSGVVCASMTSIDSEDVGYGGEGDDEVPQAHINFNVWEEEEDNKTNSDPEAMFNIEAFLSVLR